MGKPTLPGAAPPADPEPDERRIYDAYIAGRQSAALAAAVRLGLFALLDREPLTPEALAARLELRPRPVRILTRVLVAMGLLERHGDALAPSPDARTFLVPGRPCWLGGLIDLEVEHFLSPALLLEALRHDRASVYGGEDPWQRHAEDPERARAFTRAMHSISTGPGESLARHVDFGGVRRLLDVGGGSGALAIALARAWPALRVTVWDLEGVCVLAREYVAEAGLSERIEMRVGDMFAEPFPPGHDAVLLSQILHDWSPETGRRLLEAAFAALPAGGLVLVHEKLLGEQGPLANALVDLDMLVWTEGQQYDFPTLRRLLQQTGFVAIEQRPTVGYWSVVLGRRPPRTTEDPPS